MTPMPDAGLCAQIACLWEATARKPGNVHRYRDFADLSYTDFLLSAAVLAPAMTAACQRRVGDTVRDAIGATRRVVRTNTNLGMVLLLAPLAAVQPEEPLRDGVNRVLDQLDIDDARRVYEAIRLASPGGLGSAPQQDVRDEPTLPLRPIMMLAADRDLIARQYANGFVEVFDQAVPAVLAGLSATESVEGAIVFGYLHMLACQPDTLIARKRGQAEAEEASRRARSVFDAGWPERHEGWLALSKLDAWLRSEGHSRNPGATADLIVACLFVLLRENRIPLPPPYPWAAAGFDHD
jgi:triphosphoribosyl-dephospho-CoA synthase